MGAEWSDDDLEKVHVDGICKKVMDPRKYFHGARSTQYSKPLDKVRSIEPKLCREKAGLDL
jgi:hypothetical protein